MWRVPIKFSMTDLQSSHTLVLVCSVCCCCQCVVSWTWLWASFSLANLPSADTVFLSLLQESPSLWHFMTMRHGQKTTSASGKEKGSRLSTARKSLQLLIRLPALGRNAGFPFYRRLKGDGAAESGADRASHFSWGKSGSWYMEKKCFGSIIWSKQDPRIHLLYFSLWKYKIIKIMLSCHNHPGSPTLTTELCYT